MTERHEADAPAPLTDARPSFLETPEFKAAVAAAAKEAAEEAAKAAVANFAASLSQNGAVPTDSTKLFSDLALAIGEMANQGSGRTKPLAPELVQKRAAAAKRADHLIKEARRKVDVAMQNGDEEQASAWMPRYKVIAKIYFNERLIEPYKRVDKQTVIPQEIHWNGMPNDALRPLNSVAEEIFNAYRESVGMTKIDEVSGPNGGSVAPDERPYWVTPAGLVVQGDAPQKAFVGNSPAQMYALDDPSAPTVHVLGTIAQPARRTDGTLPKGL